MDDLSIEDFSPVKSQKSIIPNRGSYVDEAPDGGIGGIGASSTFDPLIGIIDNCDFPGAFRESIQEWTNEGNISFKYDKAKMKRSLKEAKKKMVKKKKDQLECNLCKQSFPNDKLLEQHNNTEEHLIKAREKSESTILGDLNTFTNFVNGMKEKTFERNLFRMNEVSQKVLLW